MTSLISSLIESQHGAIYAYGVIAAYATDGPALDNMAIHRRMRDDLITYANMHAIDIPPAQPAYQMPIPVRDVTTAKAAAAAIENLLCATWANALSELPAEYATMHTQFPIDCALRAYAYSGQYAAFPGN